MFKKYFYNQDDITRVVAECDRGITSCVVDEKRGWLFVGSDDTTASAWALVPTTTVDEPEHRGSFEEHMVLFVIVSDSKAS